MSSVIGPVIRLQIQRGPLKVGEKPDRRYSPELIAPVDTLLVTALGITAQLDGLETLDVHHGAHPAQKNDDGRNGISVGFVSHYREMQRHFGDHVTPGCAGENILVESDRRFTLEDLACGLVLLDPSGHAKGRLRDLMIATPCRPFAGFAHHYQAVDPAVLKESLRLLDGGTRGFYCTLDAASGPVRVRCGDLVALDS
ncbi:MAG TPA: hypothetical protein VF970_07000 [Gemmatimonadales bacterium]